MESAACLVPARTLAFRRAFGSVTVFFLSHPAGA